MKPQQWWREIVEKGQREPFAKHATREVLDRGVASTAFRADDVVEVAWLLDGDERRPWIAIMRLVDQRWVYFSYHHSSGRPARTWYWRYVFAAHRGRLWWFACGDEARERFTAVMSDDERADELVQLDIMLQSEDATLRQLAETRMQQVRDPDR